MNATAVKCQLLELRAVIYSLIGLCRCVVFCFVQSVNVTSAHKYGCVRHTHHSQPKSTTKLLSLRSQPYHEVYWWGCMRRQKIFRHWQRWCGADDGHLWETMPMKWKQMRFNRWTWAVDVVRLKFDFDAVWHFPLTATNQNQCDTAHVRNKSLKFLSTVYSKTTRNSLICICTWKCVSSTESVTLDGGREMGQAGRNWFLFWWK